MGKKSFILGAVLGSTIGLLLAPKTGKEARKELKSKTGPLAKKFIAEMEKVKSLNKKKYEQMVDKYAGQYLKRAGIAKDAIREIVSDLKAQWHQVNKSPRKRRSVRKTAKNKKKK